MSQTLQEVLDRPFAALATAASASFMPERLRKVASYFQLITVKAYDALAKTVPTLFHLRRAHRVAVATPPRTCSTCCP